MSNEVTVVIPTFNRPDLVIRAINSVINQDYKEKIICVIVDSSTNQETKNNIFQTQEQILEVANREIKYIKNDKSSFPIDNWVLGIEEINTKYSKFLCDDDWLNLDYISILINKMQKENTSCAVSNINIHKETENKNKIIKDYYSFETGVVSTENVINSYLKIDSILPATPTASIMLSDKLKESFYFALKHFECTKQLFGFDFLMNYYCSFDTTGTYMTNSSLANSWAGKDSMTLNIKISLLSYCNFFALLRLIDKFETNIDRIQLRQIQNILFNIKFKSRFDKRFKDIYIDLPYKPKINLLKIISNIAKRLYIKTKYNLID